MQRGNGCHRTLCDRRQPRVTFTPGPREPTAVTDASRRRAYPCSTLSVTAVVRTYVRTCRRIVFARGRRSTAVPPHRGAARPGRLARCLGGLRAGLAGREAHRAGWPRPADRHAQRVGGTRPALVGPDATSCSASRSASSPRCSPSTCCTATPATRADARPRPATARFRSRHRRRARGADRPARPRPVPGGAGVRAQRQRRAGRAAAAVVGGARAGPGGGAERRARRDRRGGLSVRPGCGRWGTDGAPSC